MCVSYLYNSRSYLVISSFFTSSTTKKRIKQENTTAPDNDLNEARKFANLIAKDEDFEAYHANLGKLNNNPPLH